MTSVLLREATHINLALNSNLCIDVWVVGETRVVRWLSLTILYNRGYFIMCVARYRVTNSKNVCWCRRFFFLAFTRNTC